MLRYENVLVLGSTGFIGNHITTITKNIESFNVTTYDRQDSCSKNSKDIYNSSKFYFLLKKANILVNCTGIGLSRLRRSNLYDANYQLNRNILSAYRKSDTSAMIINFSSLKAYNPNCHKDVYAHDKYYTEKLWLNSEFSSRVCTLRLPMVIGKNDLNIQPLIELAKKISLPEIYSNSLPKLNIISVDSLSYTVKNILLTNKNFYGKLVYIINKNTYNWNEIIRCISNKKYIVPLILMRFLWYICSFKYCLNRKRSSMPVERFYDLFKRDWIIEKNQKIEYFYLEEDALKLIKNLYEQSF